MWRAHLVLFSLVWRVIRLFVLSIPKHWKTHAAQNIWEISASKWPFAIRSFRQIRPLILKTALSYSWTTFNKVRFDETFLAAIWSNVSQIIANSCRFFFISSRNPNSHYNFYFRHFFARLVNAWYFLNGRNNKSMRTRIGLSNSNNYFLELFKLPMISMKKSTKNK